MSLEPLPNSIVSGAAAGASAPASGAGVINVGFTITQIIGFRNQLYIFGKDSIKRLVGNNFANFALESVLMI